MIAKNHNVNKEIITLPKEYFSSTCQRKIYKQSSMKIPNKVNPKPNKKISFDIKRYKKSTICFTNSFCQLLSEKANEFFICRYVELIILRLNVQQKEKKISLMRMMSLILI